MTLFNAVRDYDNGDFYIEELNSKYYKNISLDQVWEINNSNGMECEVYVEEDTLDKAAMKALKLFSGSEESNK